ncbi:hypothetical protein [Enterococcus termitis]|uniref:Uncharacterized protein n=1 Tax=Enterococcus termitis TaxID=332950 RepID=A0A1E5GZL3_9ENTE|nr:hypothetical protein [Enterococcus termitis]OEG18159.1 hypothetical protein BCR25_16845 [Enterococcus termitis]OJG97191.1 hypothetical protein RV18_GL001056 [Enterococcus termitis]
MCQYCQGTSYIDNDLLIEFDDSEELVDTVKVYVTSKAKLFLHNDYGAVTVPIKYCPMCGRELQGGADETNA